MGSGLRLDQMRAFVLKAGRWNYQFSCWPDGDKWILGLTPRGDRSVPCRYLIAEKSGEARRLTASTALGIAAELSLEGVYFNRESFRSLVMARPFVVLES